MARVPVWCIVLALVVSVFAGAQKTGTNRNEAADTRPTERVHPKVSADQECFECHRKEFLQWESGPHGVSQVKCLVCHGSVDEGFVAQPPITRCEACHSPLVERLQSDPFLKGKTCFSCHPPHSLKPHGTAAGE